MKGRGLSPKVPLILDDADGYALNKTHKEMIKQNLKMLMLTIPGERIMEPNFGVGLITYLFEQDTVATYSAIETKIAEQIDLYMPFVDIVELNFYDANMIPELNANYLHIRLEYFIKPLEELDAVDLDFDFSKQLFI